jgi:hypothetical protein
VLGFLLLLLIVLLRWRKPPVPLRSTGVSSIAPPNLFTITAPPPMKDESARDMALCQQVVDRCFARED